MVIFYMKWKKNNEIQLTKNKMDLKDRIMKKHPPSTEIHGDISFYCISVLEIPSI